jgi:hypothetical protein
MELTLRAFFEKPTIAMLATVVKEKQAGISSHVLTVTPMGRHPRTRRPLARPIRPTR